MKDILYHLLGSCGEGHTSLLTIISSSCIFIYRDYVVNILREFRDVLFK